MKAQEQTLYYHYNPHGDVIAMTDQSGNVVANYQYDVWGKVLKSETQGIAAENPFGYAGYMYDKEIGMYYLIARYYHPNHGVFLSVDPDPGDQDDPITQNGYAYANNNPVMFVDPDGYFAFAAFLPWVALAISPHVWIAAGVIAAGVGIGYYLSSRNKADEKTGDRWGHIRNNQG